MLEPSQEREVSVTYLDQQDINAFSRFTSKSELLNQDISKLKEDLEYFEELHEEMELMDEEEQVSYKIGDSFILMDLEKAQVKIGDELNKLKMKREELEMEITKLDEKMKQLKTKLYAKFGSSIHLEKD